MNTNISQATQTRDAKGSDSEQDSLDTYSLRNETWITDLDADDEAESSDRSKIKPEKLEQAISKAEMELRELQESFAKMKCLKDTKSKASQLPFQERLKCSLRLKGKPKDGKRVVHIGTQATPDSESQSGAPTSFRDVGSVRKRLSQHPTTSVAQNSSDADSSETEEIKRRETHIQEVIVKVESKIQDMRGILEKLIQTKAKQKRDKADKETMKKWTEDRNIKTKSDLNVKIKDSHQSQKKKNKNEAERPKSPYREAKDKHAGRKTESKLEIKDKYDKDKDRPSTTKSLVQDRERRSKSALSRGRRSHSAKSQGKESERKSRSRAGSSDS